MKVPFRIEVAAALRQFVTSAGFSFHFHFDSGIALASFSVQGLVFGARIGGGFGSTRGWRLLTKLLPWLNDFVIDLHSIATVDESID